MYFDLCEAEDVIFTIENDTIYSWFLAVVLCAHVGRKQIGTKLLGHRPDKEYVYVCIYAVRYIRFYMSAI